MKHEPSNIPRWDVYLSYAPQDSDFVDALRQAIEAQGWRVCSETHAPALTSESWSQIRREVEESDNFLLIASSYSLSDPLVHLMLNHAHKLDKSIIVIEHALADRKAIQQPIIDLFLSDESLKSLLEGASPFVLVKTNWHTIDSEPALVVASETELPAKMPRLIEIFELSHEDLVVQAENSRKPRSVSMTLRIGVVMILLALGLLFANELMRQRNDAIRQQAEGKFTTGMIETNAGPDGDIQRATTAFTDAAELFAQIGDKVRQADALSNLGLIQLGIQGDAVTARETYERALSLYREAGNHWGEAATVGSLGNISLRNSDLAAAKVAYGQSLVLFQAAGQPIGEMTARIGLAQVARLEGDFSTAREMYLAVQNLARQTPDLLSQANALLGLGVIAQSEGDLETAQANYELALPLFRRANSHDGAANTLMGLGDVARLRNDMDTARAAYQEALPIYEAFGNIQSQAYLWAYLGEIAHITGDVPTAQSAYMQALSLARQMGDSAGEGTLRLKLGHLAYLEEDTEAAFAFYQEALTLFRHTGEQPSEAEALYRLGGLKAVTNEPENARAYYEQALTIQETISDSRGRANTLTAIGQLELEEGALTAAQENFDQAVDLFESVSDYQSAAYALGILAELERRRGNTEVAQQYLERARTDYERALALAREQGNQAVAALNLIGLGDVAIAQEDYSTADQFYTQSETIVTQLNNQEGLITVALLQAKLLALQGDVLHACAAYDDLFEQLETAPYANAPFAEYHQNYANYLQCGLKRGVQQELN